MTPPGSHRPRADAGSRIG